MSELQCQRHLEFPSIDDRGGAAVGLLSEFKNEIASGVPGASGLTLRSYITLKIIDLTLAFRLNERARRVGSS